MQRRTASTLRLGTLAAVALTLAAGAGAQVSPLGQPSAKGAPQRSQPAERVRVSLAASKPQARPGDQLAIAVTLDFAPGWHAWTNPPIVPDFLGEGFAAIPTTIETGEHPAIAQIGPVQWPEPHAVPFLSGELQALAGTAVAYVPIILAADAPTGALEIPITVRYQACDDKVCLPPRTVERTLAIEILAAGEPSTAQADPALFADFDMTIFGRMRSGEIFEQRPPVEFNAFGWSFSIDPNGLGLALLLVVAGFGGLLLNLTPCVLPVIPIKIMGLSQAAGNPGRTLALGVVMAAGVVAFWMAIGGAIAFITGFDAINSLFQEPWFSIAVGVVIAAMALGMLGLFTVQLPKAVYMFNPSHETITGSFLFGVMTAILSTPCTAPFMGSAAAWATTQQPATTLATFGAIGLGMALPYLALSASPGLARRIPRAGPVGEIVKQTMGFFMLAVAAFFVGIGAAALLTQPPEPSSRGHWWAVAAFVIAGFAWAGWRTFRLTQRPGPRITAAALTVVAATTSILSARALTSPGPIDWIYYTPERFAQAQERGEIVLMDFTAEWCLNCKALESGVLHRERVISLLDELGVTPIKVDLTGGYPAGQAMLEELGRVAIPLLAVFGPGVEQPILYDSYTVEMVVEALERARGAGRAAQTARRPPPDATPR